MKKKYEEELKEYILAKGAFTVDKVNQAIKDFMDEKLPFFEKNQKEMSMLRGIVISCSVEVESYINEVILKYREKNLIEATFQKKIGFIKNIIRSIDKNNLFSREDLKRLDKFVAIRNLFAHVQMDRMKKNLSFNDEAHFEGYFKCGLTSNVKECIKIFIDLSEDVKKDMMQVLNLVLRDKGLVK